MLYSKNNGNQKFDISNMTFTQIMEKINEILQTKKNEEKNIIIKNNNKPIIDAKRSINAINFIFIFS